MAFNYGREKKKFEEEWKAKASWYRLEGMDEKAIQAMYEYDLSDFNARRSYENNTVSCSIEHTILSSENTIQLTGRYDWIDEIGNIELVHKLKKLTEHELEILTLLSFNGYTQEQAADIMGVPYRTFKYQLRKIKIFLK